MLKSWWFKGCCFQSEWITMGCTPNFIRSQRVKSCWSTKNHYKWRKNRALLWWGWVANGSLSSMDEDIKHSRTCNDKIIWRCNGFKSRSHQWTLSHIILSEKRYFIFYFRTQVYGDCFWRIMGIYIKRISNVTGCTCFYS